MYVDQYMGAFENFADKQAITCLSTGKTFTYRELDSITTRLGNRFRGDKLLKGDVAMVCLFNTYHLPVTMIASWKSLLIFSPINFRLAPGEIKIHIDDSQPKVFIFDSDLDDNVEKALELCEHKPPIIISTGASRIKGALEFDAYLEVASDRDPDLLERIRQVDPFHDEIERLYTSGTTGFPKGVKFTSHALFNIAIKTIYNNGYTCKDRLMNLTPWFHQGGICTAVQPGLLVGGHVFGMKQFDPLEALKLIEKQRLTFVAGAPATFNAMSLSQREQKRDLSSLRLIHSMGSAALRHEFLLWREVLTRHVVNSYGTTEIASALCLRSDLHPIEEKAGSAGKPFIFMQVRVVRSPAGSEKFSAPEDVVRRDGKEVGEIITKGPGIFHGYHNRPEEEAGKWHMGWFYTGDAGSVDPDGFITVQGRTDDMFISGGENIFPQPVEEALEKHPGVRECVVVGIRDEKWGRACAAYIVPGEPKPTVADLDRHCLENPYLARYKRPKYYQFVDSLPMTATGKKLRYRMAQRALQERDKFMPVGAVKAG